MEVDHIMGDIMGTTTIIEIIFRKIIILIILITTIQIKIIIEYKIQIILIKMSETVLIVANLDTEQTHIGQRNKLLQIIKT